MEDNGNREMNLAWQLIADTRISVFLTGKAGTGKTTFLRRLRKDMPKRMVILAPTGVAAINAEGQTIHSFFQLPFGPAVPGTDRKEEVRYRMSKEKKNIIRTLDLLVIDEVSMVRCDLLDAVDEELRRYRDRRRPFGGVQLLLVGDLQQLAPVAKECEWKLLKPYYDTPYFFSSKALKRLELVTLELKQIYRQQNEDFIQLLGKVRDNKLDDEALEILNSRCIDNPSVSLPKNENWIRLTTHNRMADEYNAQMLAELPGEALTFTASTEGNFPKNSYPAEENLVLKVGAQVMFIRNDPSGAREYYNGKIGIVKDFDENGIAVCCQEDGQFIVVPPITWQNTRYVINEETKAIEEHVEGTFRQYPLRLAWAITIHKSQGLTFDHAILDINDSFTHGQAYVALSRCRTLDGLILSHPIDKRSVITDSSVQVFLHAEYEAASNIEKRLPWLRREYFLFLLEDLFSFEKMWNGLRFLYRITQENLKKQHPEFVDFIRDVHTDAATGLISVGDRFYRQCRTIVMDSFAMDEDARVQEYIHTASVYFKIKLCQSISQLIEKGYPEISNKQIDKQLENAYEMIKFSYKTKVGVFHHFATENFTVGKYLSVRAMAALGEKDTNAGKTFSVAKIREKYGNAYAPWTREEDDLLIDCHVKGMSIAELSEKFGRNEGAIRSRLKKKLITS